MICADGAPCTDMSISNFAMWTETGSKEWYSCRSAYGSGGFCLRDGSQSTPSYATSTTTISSTPTGYTVAPTMSDDLATAFGFTLSIPIPTIPTSFFPGATPISRLAQYSQAPGGADTGSAPNSAATSSSFSNPDNSVTPVTPVVTPSTTSAPIYANTSVPVTQTAAPNSTAPAVPTVSSGGSSTPATGGSSSFKQSGVCSNEAGT